MPEDAGIITIIYRPPVILFHGYCHKAWAAAFEPHSASKTT